MRPPRRDQGAAAPLALLLVVSLVAGVLAAGLALPAVGIAGLTAKQAADSFQQLPSVLSIPPLAQRSRILAADGTTIATFYSENRVYVPISQIAPVMQSAIVAIEDSRFYHHHGVDLRGTLRAFVTNARSGTVEQGGSTLTQQYVKNLLIAAARTKAERDAASAQTVSRKLREMRYAIGLEQRLTKQQILEGYLNVAYFGDGAYGVQAAAYRYFGIPAGRLNLRQAATLAGIVQNPTAFDPLMHPLASQDRRDVVLQRMADLGDITPAQQAAAARVPVATMLRPHQVPNGCAVSRYPFFCDYVLRTIARDPVFGATAAKRRALLRQGGLTIRTTLDLNAQKGAQRSVDTAIPARDGSHKAAAIAMVQPGTGNVVAMAQNYDWGVKGRGRTTINFAVDRADGGGDGAGAGSTFKAFTLAAAIEGGIPITERIAAPSPRTFTGFTNCTTGATFPPYQVYNSTGAGTFDMRTGAAYSINTFFVALEQQAGLCNVVDMAERLGVHFANGKPLDPQPSFTLGSTEVSPLTMAEAYATFAARGLYCSARSILSVTTRSGQRLDVPPKRCSQVMDQGVADGVDQILAGVIDGPWSGRTGADMTLGRPAAGKTGTIDTHAAVWFIGYTPDLAAAVWVGDPRGGFAHPLLDITINGVYYPEVFGKSLPGPIWRSAMLHALAGVAPTPFHTPDPSVVAGVPVRVPSLGGLTPAAAVAQLGAVGLSATVAPGRVSSGYPAGTIAYTSPGGGASVASGTAVTLYLSSGVYVPPTPSPSPSTSGTATASPSPTPSGTTQTGPKPKPTKTCKPGHHCP